MQQSASSATADAAAAGGGADPHSAHRLLPAWQLRLLCPTLPCPAPLSLLHLQQRARQAEQLALSHAQVISSLLHRQYQGQSGGKFVAWKGSGEMRFVLAWQTHKNVPTLQPSLQHDKTTSHTVHNTAPN